MLRETRCIRQDTFKNILNGCTGLSSIKETETTVSLHFKQAIKPQGNSGRNTPLPPLSVCIDSNSISTDLEEDPLLVPITFRKKTSSTACAQNDVFRKKLCSHQAMAKFKFISTQIKNNRIEAEKLTFSME